MQPVTSIYSVDLVPSRDPKKALTCTRKTFASKKAFQHFMKLFSDDRSMNLLSASIIPVRPTHVSDLLIPTTVHHARKIPFLPLRIVAVFIAIFWDRTTVLIRLATAIPRYLYRKIQGDHPFIRYCKIHPSPNWRVFTQKKWVHLTITHFDGREKKIYTKTIALQPAHRKILSLTA